MSAPAPLGLTPALLLARGGADGTLIEGQPAACPPPQAVHFDDETMRLIEAAGMMASVTHVGPGMLFRSPGGRLLADWPCDTGTGETGRHESYRCHRPDVE